MENYKILLVDDDPFILQSIGPALVKKGYEVATAESGQEALDILDKSTFDLVLVDLIMEDVDGFKILKAVKELKKETMVMVLTGHNDVDLTIDCLRLGADDYVLKPCALEELLFRLQNCFEKQEAKKKAKQTEVELEENEKYLKIAQKIAKLGHWKLIAQTREVVGSDELFNIFELNENEFTLEAFASVVHPDDLEYNMRHINNGIENGEPWDIEHRLLLKDGSIKTIRAIGEPVVDESGNIAELIGTVQDITEGKKTEEALRNEKLLTEEYINSLPGLFYVFDKQSFIQWNKQWEKVTGYSDSEISKMYWPDFFKGSDKTLIEERMSEVFVTGKSEAEAELVTKQGRRISYYFNGMRKDINGKPHLIGLGIDITDRKQAEKALKDSYELNSKIISGSPIGISIYNEVGQCIEANDSIGPIIGTTKEQVLKQNYNEIESWKKSGLLDAARKAVRKQIKIRHELQLVSTFDKDLTIECHFVPFSKKEETNLMLMITDITERKKAEEQIKASLKEKETLLHEIHHRVKNNLTVVSSLLGLQAKNINDKRLTAALMDSQNRVQSMSTIHETLYQSDNLSAVDMKTYLSNLAGAVAQNYSIGSRVNLKIKAESIIIGAKQASPIGLIVNELITNSFKYAFPDNQESEIKISLQKTEDRIELEYADNGIGIPEGFDWKNTKSMGLNLVKMLAENQLDGSIDMENTNGTKFTIKFNIET